MLMIRQMTQRYRSEAELGEAKPSKGGVQGTKRTVEQTGPSVKKLP